MKFIAVIFLALFFICAVQANDCPVICPALYQPTCAHNGRCYKSFSNQCSMKVANCNGKDSFVVVEPSKCADKNAVKC
ncbi:hypothetical protein DOY81_007379 [Sarcophaga bullata]|nr:hypothetical protein DOY81_007379 [Sarcophaga bullata]